MRLKRFITAYLLMSFVLLAANAQDKVQLLYKGKEGLSVTHRLNGDISLEAAGNTFNLELKVVQKQKVIKVSNSGEITTEQTVEEYEMSFNGQKAPENEEALKGKIITTIRPNGTRVSREVEGRDEEEGEGGQEHLGQAFEIIFPDKPVGVGDKWSHEFKENKDLKVLSGLSEYELVGFEKVSNVNCAHIKVSYKATDDIKLTATGDAWVELSSGDMVKADMKLDNLPFGPADSDVPPAKATITIQRTEGSPYPEDSKTTTSEQTPKPDDKKPEEKPAEGAKQDGEEKKADEKKDDKKKEKTIAEVTKDFEKLEGLFTLYRKKEAGKETLYLEIKEDQLDTLHLLQATVSKGVPGFVLTAGAPINDIAFKFVRRDEQVLFVIPNLGFRADPKKPIFRAYQNSFAEAYLEAFKIEAKNEEGKTLLINVSDLFRGDIAQVSQVASAAAGGNYSIDREKTVYNQVKMFPENLFVQTAYNFSGGRSPGGANPLAILGLSGNASLADPRSMPVTVNYNLSRLPENNGYVPRYYDPRVGYFTAEYQDITEDKDDQMVRYILRWHLEKADPQAKLSPPKQPIVFWIDNGVPNEYRDATKKGILLWNKAFEKVGIKDAIEVKQMPDDADWDHADMRYNVIRWIASPGDGYAVALFRVNPLTGQILNAGINVDSNMTRFAKMQTAFQIDPIVALNTYLHEADQCKDRQCAHAMNAKDPRACNYGTERTAHAAYTALAASLLAEKRGGTKRTPQEMAEEFVVETVAHEMGHILGLRHNFVASTVNTLQDLANPNRVREIGTTASVMDYNPPNIMAIRTQNNYYYSPTIGPYDFWAIEYGYTQTGASKPDHEKDQLAMVARRCNQEGLAFESDEYADNFDPFVVRFDLAKDPIGYFNNSFEDLRDISDVLATTFPKRGERYFELTKAFSFTVGYTGQTASQAVRFIGGTQTSRNFKGDPGEKPVMKPVSAQDQRRALNLLRDNVFSRKAFNYPESLFEKLGLDPSPPGFRGSGDMPVRDMISGIQAATLRALFSPTILRRVGNNEFKTQKQKEPFTLSEMFSVVRSSVWEELKTGDSNTTLRRQLQRAHLQTLVDMVAKPSSAPDDAKMLARYHLRMMRADLQAVLPKARSEYDKAHYSEAVDLIGKALNAQFILNPGGGGQQPNLLQMLGLGKENE
ncbi:MAG: zinc-dependent metalloprotease [Fimbriimonadia bacterium]|nr:zinc-dependent metalloprotease [Fimbriimonadia bacterium]